MGFASILEADPFFLRLSGGPADEAGCIYYKICYSTATLLIMLCETEVSSRLR